MIRAIQALGLLAVIAGISTLSGQEPKKDPAPNLPVIGNFKSVDEAKKTITIEAGFGKKKETQVHPLADSVEVRYLRGDSEAIKLSDLKADERINLILDPDSKKVVRVISLRAARTTIQGEYRSIDRNKENITLEVGPVGNAGKKEEKTYPLSDSVDVQGPSRQEKLKLTDLVRGDHVTLTLHAESKKVTQIAVQPARIPSGVIKSIDLDKKSLVVGSTRNDGKETTIHWGENVAIEKYFRTIAATDLKVGMRINATMGDDRKTVSRIIITESNGPQTVLGRIQAIDPAKRTMTIDAQGFGKASEKKDLKIANDVAIKIGAKEGKLTDLVTGLMVTVFAENDSVIGLSAFSATLRYATIAKVDAEKSTVTLKIYDESITASVNATTRIREGLREIKLKDLKEGQEVTFTLSADQKVLESISISFSFGPGSN